MFAYLLLSSVVIANGLHKPLSLMEAIYWEVKPYIFTNEEGKIAGIIPKIFEKGQNYCMRNSEPKILLEFVRKELSREDFFNLMRSDVAYGEGQLENITKEKALWGPVISDIFGYNNLSVQKGFRSFLISKCKYFAVIVPRYVISLPNKILHGLLSSLQIILIALLLSIFFAIIIWLIEKPFNDQFNKAFIKGSLTALWWTIISMTTVGYGDVVPRTAIGRSIGIIWLFIGVMMACLITAVTTKVVTGSTCLSVHDEMVSVLKNSYEETAAIQDYRIKAVSAESYEEVIDLVRQGKVFAAMINADVAAWYQEEICNDSSYAPLRIVDKLPANLYMNIMMYVDAPQAITNVTKCMQDHFDEVYHQPKESFDRYVNSESLYIESIPELFKSSIFIQVLLGMVCCSFFFGIIYDIYHQFFCYHKVSKWNNSVEYNLNTEFV